MTIRMEKDIEHHVVLIKSRSNPGGLIRLHVVQAGPSDGPLIILLHGFPEFWYGWRRQIVPLAAAGYRVWVPDQRGYNLSEKPAGVEAYVIDLLADDVIGLIDAAGREQAFLVGHDWGAAVAWRVAARYPDRLQKLVIMNVPHPAVMARFVWQRPRQLLRSWYIIFFQLPLLPEWVTRLGHWRLMARALQRTSRPGTFSGEDLAHYRQAWSQPNAFRSMVNWYRAAVRKRPVSSASGRIKVPTLVLWGARDAFLIRDMAQPSVDRCEQGQLVFFEQASHWIQHEEAPAVNQWLLQFCRS